MSNHEPAWYCEQAARLGHPGYITLAEVRDAERREVPEPVTECAACGTADGPDRRARWEAGVADRETWERCERCGAPLCDGCALAGTRHDRPGTDRECAAAQLARTESSACGR